MNLRIDPVGIVLLIWFIWAGDQYIKQEIEEDAKHNMGCSSCQNPQKTNQET